MQYIAHLLRGEDLSECSTCFTSILQVALLFGLAGALTGCGSAETTLQKDWEADVGMDSRTINVEPKREHLLVGKEKSTTIVGDGGNVIYGDDGGGFGSMMKDMAKEAVEVGGVSLADLEANKLDYVMLSEPGIALVFDYTAQDDIIRALNMETGEKMWEQTDYRWSLEKYQAVGATIAKGVLQNAGVGAGAMAGAASASANSTLMRERYVSNLVAEVPNRNAVLLKTVDDVRLIDLDTGETQWSTEKVDGSSLMHVEWLSSGDVVLATGFSNLLGNVSGGRMLRIDPSDGTVKWRSNHDTDAIRNTYRRDEYLLFRQGDGDITAFRIDDGTKAYEIGMDWKAKLTSGSFSHQGQEYQVNMASAPVLHENALYAPDLADVDVVGKPDHNVRKISLTTGESQWSTDSVKETNAISDLTVVNDQIVARAISYDQGLFGADGHQELVSWNLSNGEKQWSRESPWGLSRAGMVGMAAKGGEVPTSFNLVMDQGRAYVANDTSVVAYNLQDGSVAASTPAKAPGAPGGLVWLGEQKQSVMDLREEGVSFHAKSDLSLIGKPITFESDMETFTKKAGYLIVSTGDVFHVINMKKQKLKGTVAPEEDLGSARVSGNMRSGVYVTEGGKSLFILTENTDDEERLVKKYVIK